MAFDSSGNLYFAEPNVNQIRRLTPAGKVEAAAGLPNQTGLCKTVRLGTRPRDARLHLQSAQYSL